MIVIQTLKHNVVDVSELLVQCNITAEVLPNKITILQDRIPDAVLKELFSQVTVVSFGNYDETFQPLHLTDESSVEQGNKDSEETADDKSASTGKETTDEEDSTPSINVTPASVENTAKVIASIQEMNEQEKEQQMDPDKEPDRLWRGQVFKWGSIRGSDEHDAAIKDCVIIIQNDYDNNASDETIALLCTSDFSKRSQLHYNFKLNSQTMNYCSPSRLLHFYNASLFTSRIIGINKSQLGRYLGTMKNTFMNTLQPSIDYCLGLKRSRNVDWVQLNILSRVDVSQLFDIAKSESTDEEKVDKYLELFGFDMSKKGIVYVKKAILKAFSMPDYRMEHLATAVSYSEHVDEKEVLRVIVARIKETFNMKQSPALSFIRLVVCLLKGSESNDY